ncbi:MAG: kelch repeat-containing protein [Planctomycetota bacterium]|nr:kelch repeat-containing protein [Planctomycetota bacterium]
MFAFRFALSLALLAVTLAAQGTWIRRYSDPSPSSRYGHAMAFDSHRQVTVLFGGSAGPGALLRDTWEWDGRSWSRRVVAGTLPTARAFHCLAYDAHRKVVVLYGGATANGRPQHMDTWEWDGKAWTKKSTGSGPLSPTAMSGAAMVYDPVSRQMILFGGRSRTVLATNETWAWSGSRWTRLKTPSGPSARTDFAMTFDRLRQVVMLFGGVSAGKLVNDLWEFDGLTSTWTQRTSSSTWPSARIGPMAFAYAEHRRKLFLHGGRDLGGPLRDTWEWDGRRWIEMVPVSASPSGRYGHAAVFDAGQIECVAFGGNLGALGGKGSNETWSYRGPELGMYQRFGKGCMGTKGPLSLEVLAPPVTGNPLVFEIKNALPNALGGVMFAPFSRWLKLPLTSCMVYAVSNSVLPFKVDSAGRGRAQIKLPFSRWVVGMEFYNQAIVIDRSANTVGIVTSNAGWGVVGW